MVTPEPRLLARAYAACQRMAREHYENFPVASWLLPPSARPHVAAVYAFARAADDFADEGERTVSERLRLLDQWHGRLRAAANGQPAGDDSEQATLVFLAVGETMRRYDLPLSLFEDLLSAFRQDVTKHRYATFQELLDYARRSANPVGRLVLAITGCRDEPVARSSDALCTALQLTNFWQDIERDWKHGRLYVPVEELSAVGASPEDLDRGAVPASWRPVLASLAFRTARLFECGRTVCDAVDGRLRWELRATWLGGRRILDRLGRNDFNVFVRRPALGAADAGWLLWQAVRWRP